ncbi:MAG: amidohydrolase [Clostridia bacterium]
MDKIITLAENLFDYVQMWRRDFHKYAEAAWREYRTSSLIAKELEELGYKVLLGEEIIKKEERMGLPDEKDLKEHYQRALKQGAIEKYTEKMKYGLTGVVGILDCGPGPIIGMRFDIDAVEMDESHDPSRRAVKEGFASVNEGAMHSCGHDGHAAIGLGVAKVLSKIKDELKGTIKLVFQPAEEGVRGAKSVVYSGLLDDVDYMLASHLGSGTPVGVLSCGRGNFLATEKFDATFVGKASHAGGSPENGNNALIAAANAIMNLYAITRHSDGPTRINVGKIIAGSGRNVIAPKAHLVVETRGQTTQLSEFMYNKAMKILENSAAMYDCELSIKSMGSAKSGSSDQKLAEYVCDIAKDTNLFTSLELKRGKGGGSEDYTYMMERVQSKGGLATFMGLGADLGGWSHHTDHFDIDEEALVKGVAIFSLFAQKKLAE